jgi:hypothetical protein
LSTTFGFDPSYMSLYYFPSVFESILSLMVQKQEEAVLFRQPNLKQKRVTLSYYSFLVKWRLQESNQGHTDFQSVALPTELRRRPYLWVQRYKLNSFDNNIFLFFLKILILSLLDESKSDSFCN